MGLYYDEGITGTKKDVRAGLLSMIDACEDGKIDFIITKSISRFARNTTDCLAMVRRLLELDIYIYFEKENINTGSMESELMLSILSSLAESESVSISENSKWSVQKRFQNGTFIISYPPYGYDNDNGTMVIVPEQAEIVKEIFASCLAGKGTHAIAKELNAKGIKTKKNGRWGAGAVKAILTNEKYTGDVIFQKTYSDSSFNRHVNYGERDCFFCENHHEPIISHEDFDKVRAVLDQRAMEKDNGTDTYRYQNRYCFSGKIKCGECGDTFKRRQHYKPSGDYVAWTCSTHLESKADCSMLYISDALSSIVYCSKCGEIYRRVVWNNRGNKSVVWRCCTRMENGPGTCDADAIHESELQSLVIRAINRALARKDTMNEALQKNLEAVLTGADGIPLAEIDSRLEELQKELLKVANSKGNYDSITDEIYRLREARQSALVDNAEREGVKQRISEMQQFLTEQTQDITEYDEQLVRRLIEKITVYEEKVTVEFKSGTSLDVRR